MGQSSLVEKRPVLIPSLIASVMLILALAPWPYGYYMLLRLVVCGVAVFIAVKAMELKRDWAIWTFGFIAVLFNPFILVHLAREIWLPIDIVFAVLFLYAAFMVKK